MWISAAYYPIKSSSLPPLAVRVKEESEELLVQDAAKGDVLHRWPFAELSLESSGHLSEPTDSTKAKSPDKLILFREENGPRIEITDLTALRGSGWAWRLPNQPPPPKPLSYGLPVACAILFFGLALVGFEVFTNPSVELESRIYDGIHVFPDSQICSTPEGRAALQNLLAKVSPPSSEVKIRAEIIRGEETSLFAFPAGRIFIFDSLLQKTESPDEFADLVAHLAAHESLRHPLKALREESALALLAKIYLGRNKGEPTLEPATIHFLMRARYNSDQEESAVALSDRTLATSQINQNAFIDFVNRFKAKGSYPGLFTQHPALIDGRETKEAAKAPALSASEWAALKKICAGPATSKN